MSTTKPSSNQKPVQVYSTSYCPYCTRAKNLLSKKGYVFEEIDVSDAPDRRAWLVKTTGRRTVPQIFIDGNPVGGYDDIADLDRRGELERLVRGG